MSVLNVDAGQVATEVLAAVSAEMGREVRPQWVLAAFAAVWLPTMTLGVARQQLQQTREALDKLRQRLAADNAPVAVTRNAASLETAITHWRIAIAAKQAEVAAVTAAALAAPGPAFTTPAEPELAMPFQDHTFTVVMLAAYHLSRDAVGAELRNLIAHGIEDGRRDAGKDDDVQFVELSRVS